MDLKVEAALKGIGAEIPFVRGYIDSLESAEQSRLVEELETSKISSMKTLVGAVNRLNPNLGRGLEIREAWTIRRPYRYREKTPRSSLSYWEHFDKDEWGVNTAQLNEKEWFDAFAIYLVFNNDERATTITDVMIRFWLNGQEVNARLDRVREGADKWRTVDQLTHTIRVPNNASVKLFLRFVSPLLLQGAELPVHVVLTHTSGVAQRIHTAMKLDPIPPKHWIVHSDGGSSTGVAYLPRNHFSPKAF